MGGPQGCTAQGEHPPPSDQVTWCCVDFIEHQGGAPEAIGPLVCQLSPFPLLPAPVLERERSQGRAVSPQSVRVPKSQAGRAGWHLLANPSSIPCLLRALGQSLSSPSPVSWAINRMAHLSPKGTRVFVRRKPLYSRGLAPSCPSSNSCHGPLPSPLGRAGGGGRPRPSPTVPGCCGEGASFPEGPGSPALSVCLL